MAKKEAIEVLKAWDKLEGNKHYSNSEINKWLSEDMAPAMKVLRDNLKYDYNKNCSRPDGCYSKNGKCICNLGCDCSCHEGKDDEE